MKANILTLAITLTLGVILAGSLLVPVISDAQKTIGDPITLTNGSETSLLMDYYTDDFTMIYENDTITIGDYSLARSSGSEDYRIMFWEFGRIILNRASASVGDLWVYDYRVSSSYTAISTDVSISYDADEKTITITDSSDSSTLATITAETVMAIKEDGRYVCLSGNNIGTSYYSLKSVTDYSLGFFDTTTTYGGSSIEIVADKNGISVYGLPEGTDYTATLSIVGGSVVDDTTDIYSGGVPTITLKIGDTTLTLNTYRSGMAVLNEVQGHKDAGAAYSIIGVLPILVIVALVIGAVEVVRISRAD